MKDQLRLWSERVITHCQRSGRLLIVSEERDGFIYSEYVGEGGLCFDCARKK